MHAQLQEEQHARHKHKKRAQKQHDADQHQLADLRQKLEERIAKLNKASSELQALAAKAESQATAFEAKVRLHTQLAVQHASTGGCLNTTSSELT